MNVIICNEQGENIEVCEKVKAHKEGLLHKAFSVYIFRNSGTELLVQRRSDEKMLWGGFWANTCCSHEVESEDVIVTAKRRLNEEMGFTCSNLKLAGNFVYFAEDSSGKGAEHEYLSILVGEVDEVEISADPAEVSEWKWVKVEELLTDMENNSQEYAPWFVEGINSASTRTSSH
ncbi:isopentenyl-diphosphate Delta-isomerase [Candidatus Peribacteria bacterium]|jgi:isopentenyl-diphosphate Delta-isomerase|nr:isopentenyl-diphosphate Delta-isomerase [Candidatus Peribacteria bacterium]MBT4021649.1 isopentenyl-diphosphate Delta-isomerase [Candidatus Peribacteria bacterium]MBT4240813.1 isopentenyl-diphosphate Delta-isomerase [Candidatus Peribacteria bacterium]MBT4474158.1 isopentenyl-diphosphate Delta-isomerase [Candidatus Peribacteria bacterium]